MEWELKHTFHRQFVAVCVSFVETILHVWGHTHESPTWCIMLTAVVLRFIRSKLFLTAIFFASFTYFVVNFYSDVSWFSTCLLFEFDHIIELNIPCFKNSDPGLSNDVDVHELNSGRRPLGHIFQWQGSEISNDSHSNKPISCRNSVQGKALIADDKGEKLTVDLVVCCNWISMACFMI